MAKKEYEIISHDALDRMKGELEELKSGSSTDSSTLLHSVNSLSSSLEQFSHMFEMATKELKEEEKEQEFIMSRVEPMNQQLQQKMDMLLQQNEQIAKGIVALADMMNREIPQLKGAIIRLQQSPSPIAPEIPPPLNTPRAPMPPPPMPPGGNKKFGLF